MCVCVCVCVCVYLFIYTSTQSVSASSMWYNVHFKAEFNGFEFRVFLLLDRLPY